MELFLNNDEFQENFPWYLHLRPTFVGNVSKDKLLKTNLLRADLTQHEVNFFELQIRINPQKQNYSQTCFNPLIRGLDGFDLWKKKMEKYLLTPPL